MKLLSLSVALVLLLANFALGHLTGGHSHGGCHGGSHGHGCGLLLCCDPTKFLFPARKIAPKIPHLVVSPDPLLFHLTSYHRLSLWDRQPHKGGLLLIDPDSNSVVDLVKAHFKRQKMMLFQGKKFDVQKPFHVVIRLNATQPYSFKVSFAQLYDHESLPIKSEALTMPKVQRGPTVYSMFHDYLVASENVPIDQSEPFAQVSPGWIDYGGMDERCDPTKGASSDYLCYYFRVYADSIGRSVYMKIANELPSIHNLEIWKVLTPDTSRISLDSIVSNGEREVPAKVAPASPQYDEASTSSSSGSDSNVGTNHDESERLIPLSAARSKGKEPFESHDSLVHMNGNRYNLELSKISSISSRSAESKGKERVPEMGAPASPDFEQASTSLSRPSSSSSSSSSNSNIYDESQPLLPSSTSHSEKKEPPISHPQKKEPRTDVPLMVVPKIIPVRSCSPEPKSKGRSGKNTVKIGPHNEDCYPLSATASRPWRPLRLPRKKRLIEAADNQGTDKSPIQNGESR